MKTAISIALLAASLYVVPAFAQDNPPPERSRVVSFADLDLASEAGQSKLDRRIRAAAKEVCGTASDADVEGKNDIRDCRADTYSQASRQVAVAIASAQKSQTVLASR